MWMLGDTTTRAAQQFDAMTNRKTLSFIMLFIWAGYTHRCRIITLNKLRSSIHHYLCGKPREKDILWRHRITMRCVQQILILLNNWNRMFHRNFPTTRRNGEWSARRMPSARRKPRRPRRATSPQSSQTIADKVHNMVAFFCSQLNPQWIQCP